MSRRGNNNNAAAAAARGGSSSDSEEDEQLSRLLNRLQREHATNFPDSNSNNNSNNTVNRTRARYLLEASAGNVGLASALYWEDYLAESAQGGNGGGAAENPLPEDLHRSSSSGGASISSTAAVAGSKSVKSSKKKSSFEKAEGGTSGARDRYLKAAAASSSARKKPPTRKPDPNEWNLDRRKPALPASSGGNKKRKSSDSSGIDFSGIPKKRSRRSNSNDSDDTTDDRKPSAREKIKIKKEPGLSSGSGSMDSSDGGGVGEFRRRAGPKDDSLSRELDEKISSLQNRLMAYRSQLEASAPSVGSGEFSAAAAAGRRDLDAASALGISPGRFAAADAALRGGSGADAFAAAMNAILRVDPSVNPREGYESWLAELGRSNNRSARAGAGAGGNGGDDDDDDSDNESNSSNNAKSGRDELDDSNSSGNRNNARDGADNNDDNEEDDAPLRRSMRLRSQRNPLPRRPNPRAARLAAQRRLDEDDSDEDIDENPPLNPADRLRARLANAAIDHNVNGIPVHDAMDVSDPDDDDITFLPGPVPVFRLKKKRPGEPRYQSAKNSKDIWNKPSLLQKFKYMQDSDDESDEEPVDVDIWLNKSASFEDPSKELWGSYPRNEDESDDDDPDDEGRVNIPISWLRSGFKLSKCGNGLAVSSPSDEEWERRRKTSSVLVKTGPLKDARGLFPYNCQGVSALLSIVTALLYSGASVQGGSTVACDTEKAPFDSLSLEQRKREFDPRLVEALSSLIFIAAKAGSRRCEATLNAYEEQWARGRRKGPTKPEEEDTYTIKRLELQRRCRVAAVCWWEMDLAGNITKLPEGKDPKDVHFKTSNTNIHDIKSYVRTHLKSFKEPGGMALFLETILRCHGPTLKLPKKLLNYQSSDALKQLEMKYKKNKNGGNEVVLSKVHDCMSVELLSLLLTGEIHNSYTSWDADIFGIGLIQRNNNKTILSPKMLRPVKPIWLCVGDLGYSTLFLDTKNFIGSLNTLDNPGRAFLLSHWNVWSGDRTSFKVITSMHDGVFNQDTQKTTLSLGVIPDDSDSEEEEEGRTVKESISRNLYLEEKRNASVQDTVSSYQDQAFKPDLKPITDEELASVTFHPEDEKYYPTQFRRWRYHFGFASTPGMTEVSASDDDSWIPFYRLHGRQRLIVEMKLAPLICGIVRSRWPMATVRDFAGGKVPIV